MTQHKAYARCMGGKFCAHGPGECTSDPEYQAALASAKAEPVAWMYDYGHSRIVKENRDPGMTGYTETPLYAVPPRTAEDERADTIAWISKGAHYSNSHISPSLAATFAKLADCFARGDHVGAAQ